MNKILIVDDDRSVAEMVRMALEENGYAVVTSAEDAKKAIATERPAIALIDIILPGQGGMDLILDLHSLYPDLKIIITSGKIDMNKSTFKVLAHQFGVMAILPKPFTIEELMTAVVDAEKQA
ncbi:MAG TPA: response regulator [Treponemataceae bacterium]|nr:response regulator [Treponemataceae bacterium]